MDLPDAVRNLFLGNGDSATVATDADPEERAAKMDGGQIVAEGADQIAIEVPEDSDVDPEQIEAALQGQAGSLGVQGEAGGDTTVTPVASGTDIHITDSAFDLSQWEYKAFLDDQITHLMDNRVDYNQQTGQWILANDDMIPGILIRLKSLILGRDGLQVSPEDPDTEADQRLADHLERIYEGEPEVDAHVDPGRVVDRVLEQNVMNAVYVGRSTDLQHIDVDDLSYVKDGETGEEIYIQDPTSYTTFDIEEDGEPTVEYGYKDESTALEIGEEVLDVRLYRTPPLQAVADDVVNKMQLKRLQGRKAEIASIGGIIIKVNPPAWLAEEDYDQYVAADDDDFSDESGRLLELVMAQQIDAALETLESYQTATVMSIPENWEHDTIDLPEMDESMSSMIRDYNEAISRRLLLPLDLIELKEGPELSRNSMLRMFLDQVAGWQGQITDLFDSFAHIQAEIHGMSGSVVHDLPAIEAQDEQEILNLFNFAGLLGLSESEGRELANILEGVDLETDQTEGMPPEGGPEDADDREQQMREFLDQQPGSTENGQDQGPAPGDEGGEPQGGSPEDGMEAATHPGNAIRFGNPGGDPFRDEDTLEAFVNELIEAGANQVWIGSEQFGDHSGIHDRPIIVSGLSEDAAASVWESFQDESIALMGPHQMEASISRIDAALSDEGAIKAGQDGKPICWVCGKSASLVNETPPNEFTCDYHGISPNHVPIGQADIEAAKHWGEGDEVDTPEGMGVVVEVRTDTFDGPDGEVEASEDEPAYVVGVEGGVEVFRGSDLSGGEIDADVESPEGDLADDAEGMEATVGWIEAARGDGRFSYPDSWEESETPARLILLKAWAGMNGQFDCGGDCCKGEMLSSGMSEPAANRFCASMKDRVLGGWEGWRRGGGSAAPVQASHGFSGFETAREAAAHIRDIAERRTPEGHTTEMRKRDDGGFAVVVRDREGNFRASMVVREAETEDDQWVVIGGQQFGW